MSLKFRRATAIVRLATCTVCVALAIGLGVQTFAIGPDNYGYTAIPITPFFEDLTLPDVSSTGILDFTEDAAVTIPIGFPFTFYGVTYTTVSVATNGIITFGGADTGKFGGSVNGATAVNITTTATPANLKTIAPFWHDWSFAFNGSDEALYYTAGAPGSRRLIVQWDFAISYTGPSEDTVTFEVKLFEGSNNIEFHYEDTTLSDDPSRSNGNDATVGIRDVNGQTNGRVLQWSYNQAVLADMAALRFASPVFQIKGIVRSGNSVVLKCRGAPGKPNYVEATTDIKNIPFARIGSPVTGDIRGNFTFIDTSPGTNKVYRVGFP